MVKIRLCIVLVLSFVLAGCSSKDKYVDLKVLQLNAWHQTSAVPNGFSGLVSLISQTDPDIILFSEVGGANKEFIPQLLDSLKGIDKVYYGETSGHSSGFISKYEIVDQQLCCESGGNGAMVKSTMIVGGQTVVAYSTHLDYRHYECYLPRGYSGTTWKKLDTRVADADSVLEANRLSKRDEGITDFIKDAKAEIEKGNLVLLGGDFNEPSHLDWQADTKDLRDHNGLVINWDCSIMLSKMGMIDSYRELYPDAVKYPGITYPSANSGVEASKLTWAPEADERDRIDFIYYHPDSNWTLKSASIVGPEETIKEGKTKEKDSEDTFIVPTGVWPTDHKGNLATFAIKINSDK